MSEVELLSPGARLAQLQGGLRDVVFGASTVTVNTGTVNASDAWHGKMVKFTVGCIVTIPSGLRADLSFGWSQDHADPVTFAAGGGVTLQSLDSALETAGQYALGGCVAWASNVFRLYGPLV